MCNLNLTQPKCAATSYFFSLHTPSPLFEGPACPIWTCMFWPPLSSAQNKGQGRYPPSPVPGVSNPQDHTFCTEPRGVPLHKQLSPLKNLWGWRPWTFLILIMFFLGGQEGFPLSINDHLSSNPLDCWYGFLLLFKSCKSMRVLTQCVIFWESPSVLLHAYQAGQVFNPHHKCNLKRREKKWKLLFKGSPYSQVWILFFVLW